MSIKKHLPLLPVVTAHLRNPTELMNIKVAIGMNIFNEDLGIPFPTSELG